MAYIGLGQLGPITVWNAPTVEENLTKGYYVNRNISKPIVDSIIDSSEFSQKIKNVPGQPYQLQITPQEIEKKLYADMKVEEIESGAPGTSPQEVVKLKSGLEVPTYILKRDAERKEIEEVKEEIESNKPPFFFVAEYAKVSPGKASLIALGLGALLANYLLK